MLANSMIQISTGVKYEPLLVPFRKGTRYLTVCSIELGKPILF